LPDLPVRTVQEMGLKELERIRLILRGGSVIDWRRLHMKTRDEVDRFLRLCQIDPSDPADERWARLVLADAVEYLRRTFNYRVTDAVANPPEIHDLFLYASGVKEPQRWRKIACIVLKVMHVIQHIEGRDLFFRLPVSEADLSQMVTLKVTSVVNLLRQKGLVVEFSDSIKTRESVITKLIAKKETVAAQVYDKTRFRLVTGTREEILPVLYFLTQRLFPFNFVVPDQTDNSLIEFKSLLERYPHFSQYEEELHLDLDYEDREDRRGGNVHSGAGYRNLNFVVDIPVRMDAFLPPPADDHRPRPGRVAYALVEFQIVDRETAIQNEAGENAHDRYKHRQKLRVLRRLSRGLVVPKKDRGK
jgi:uncharacterized protein (TIGR04552 family)